MNPVFKILSGIIIKINRMIDSLSLQTQETIRRSFFFLMFIFIIVGIITGYDMGMDSARIKNAPIAEYVNDTFKIDINREKNAGDFSEMLESEILKDSKMNNFQKFSFPAKEKLNTDVDRNIYEIENSPNIRKTGPKAVTEKGPVEGSKSDMGEKKDPIVRPLEKSSDRIKGDSIIINNQMNKKTKSSARDNKSEVELLKKDREMKPDIIIKDRGIVDR